MKEIECPECGKMIPADSLYCDQCGAELLECISCGALGTGLRCAECGHPMMSRKLDNPKNDTKDAKDEPKNEPLSIHTTVGTQRKSLVLKARKGDIVIRPENKAEIGRTVGPYAKDLSPLEFISRRHGKFMKQGQDWYIVDFGSTNGTLVNDVELSENEPVQFRAGDIIDIGTYLFDVIEQ